MGALAVGAGAMALFVFINTIVEIVYFKSNISK